MITLPKNVSYVKNEIQPGNQYFLVGGAVRDLLLNKSSKDLDIVCSGDIRPLARRVADRTNGAFYVLDAERNIYRVIITDDQGERVVFDFTQMRGASIEEDLLQRDFTINAIALNIADPQEFIDPLRGGKDLQQKVLRPCSPKCFMDDPLRVIRAIRYSVALGLRIDPLTIKEIKSSAPNLAYVSKERRRDELFKILENEKPFVAVELLNAMGIWPQFNLGTFQDLDLIIQRIKRIHSFTNYLAYAVEQKDVEFLFVSSFIAASHPYRRKLADIIFGTNLSGRKLLGLIYLVAMLWNQEDDIAIQDPLALSKEESEDLSGLLSNKDIFHKFAANNKDNDRRAIYLYFKSLGKMGLILPIISLAETSQKTSTELNYDLWIREIECVERIFSAWFDLPEIIDPRPLITGKNLMFDFDLTPGPFYGNLLEGLREEQAAGTITTHQEALDWVEQQIMKKKL